MRTKQLSQNKGEKERDSYISKLKAKEKEGRKKSKEKEEKRIRIYNI